MADIAASTARAVPFSVTALAVALRPKQWIKNGFVLAALVFAGKLTDPTSVGRSVWAVLVFCALSSSCYLINDIVDVAADRRHPLKSRRPIASGRVSVRAAVITAGLLAVAGLGAALGLGLTFLTIAVAYVALTVAYSFGLKRIIVIDVVAVATGFVLRAAAGAAAIDVPMTAWLAALTLIVAGFIILGKRRADAVLASTTSDPISTGPRYDIRMLDRAMHILAAAGVVGYAAYTVFATTMVSHRPMILTIPFVIFGLGRYLYLIRARGEGGAPEDAVLHDLPLLLGLGGWLLASICALYL